MYVTFVICLCLHTYCSSRHFDRCKTWWIKNLNLKRRRWISRLFKDVLKAILWQKAHCWRHLLREVSAAGNVWILGQLTLALWYNLFTLFNTSFTGVILAPLAQVWSIRLHFKTVNLVMPAASHIYDALFLLVWFSCAKHLHSAGTNTQRKAFFNTKNNIFATVLTASSPCWLSAWVGCKLCTVNNYTRVSVCVCGGGGGRGAVCVYVCVVPVCVHVCA